MLLKESIKTDTAVLLLIFNRPDSTRRVMRCLKMAQPNRLYIAADGPRLKTHNSDIDLCEQARAIAISVDWPCDVFTLFRDTNLGCKRAVSSAINWFFENEEEGIILEDDCLPHIDFFRFCSHGLNRYRNNESVYVITGDNFQDGIHRGDLGDSYYFSKYPHCWGWATWRSAWKIYDENLSFWNEWFNSDYWYSIHDDPIERNHWAKIAHQVRNSSLNSWATPWMFSIWFNHGLTMTPNVNLVTNIGFGPGATHTLNRSDISSGIQSCSIGDIKDTKKVTLSTDADRYVFLHHYGGRNLIYPRKFFVQLKFLFSKIIRTVFNINR